MDVSDKCNEGQNFSAAPVDEDVVESEFENEGLELLLHLEICVFAFLPGEDVKSLYRPTVHIEFLQSGDVFKENENGERKDRGSMKLRWVVWGSERQIIDKPLKTLTRKSR